MKKILVFFALFGFILTANAFAQDDDDMVNPDQLPSQIKEFVQMHFPGSKIAEAEREEEIFGGVEYEVWLSNGTHIEFDNTQPVDIESDSELPGSIVPDEITSYVNAEYSDSYIVSWEFEDGRQGIELNTGEELIFDEEGNFIEMDD